MRTEIITTILVMAAATFITRFTSPALLGNANGYPWLRRLLKHMPTAILTALIAPMLFSPHGHVELSIENHYLFAGMISAFLAYRRQSPILTMGAGMAVMLVMRNI